MKYTYPAVTRLLALILTCAMLFAVSPQVHAAGKVYYPIDFSQEVLDARILQRVSGGCAVASMATVEAYLFGAVSDDEKELVYDALVAANGDDSVTRSYVKSMGI